MIPTVLTRSALTRAGASNPRLQWEDRILGRDIFIDMIPSLLERCGRGPRILRISQPKPNEVAPIDGKSAKPDMSSLKARYDLLLLRRILKSIPRMENAQVVGKLHITLAKIQRQGMLLGQEVQGIESFGLCFSDGWDIG